MDVHRSRFIPYPSSAITALAFSRSSDSGYTGPLPALKLAIGRANGDIELWNPQKGLWVQETVISGTNKSIDGLSWTQDPNETVDDGEVVVGQQRLFSIASSPAVTEWDLATGKVKRVSTGNFSEVWCFTAQPRAKLQSTGKGEDGEYQELVAGCGDGTLVLLSTQDGDLQFKRILARVSGKRVGCLCMAYQNRDRVVTGFEDSMIRIYDTRNTRLIRSMSLGEGIPGAPRTVLVWQVRCLPNGDIVSGDSNGEIKFWDSRTYSMTQRVKGHDTDCLDLVTSSDGKTIFSGSIDGRLAVYRSTTSERGRRLWAKNSHKRVHSGEVKAMAAFDAKGMSVVVSGGSDMAPKISPLREYGKENLRILPTLPQHPPVVSAPSARLVVSWRDRTISVWRIAKHSSTVSAPEAEKPRKLVSRIDLATKDKIRDVSISADGRLIAAVTNTEAKVFQLRKRPEHESYAVRKLQLPEGMSTAGGRLVSISPDGKWLALVTPDSEVHLARAIQDSKRPKHITFLSRSVELDRNTRPGTSPTPFREYERVITHLAFAPDSSAVAVSDFAGFLDTWMLEGREDLHALPIDDGKPERDERRRSLDSDADSDSDSSDNDDETLSFFGQCWIDNHKGHLLPKLTSSPLVLTFRPSPSTSKAHALLNGDTWTSTDTSRTHSESQHHHLFIITAKHQIYEFDLLAGRLSDWSRRNPTQMLPDDFTKIRDRVMGAVWDCGAAGRQRLWTYGSSFVCMLNVGGDLGDGADVVGGGERKRRRRAVEGDDEGGDEGRRKMRKSGSGAGSRVEAARREGALGVVVRHGVDDGMDIDHQDGAEASAGEEDEDDEEDDMGFALTRVRRSGDEQQLANTLDSTAQTERKWWCTFKYRPILGMVPLEDDTLPEGERPSEVALIERPLWDSSRDG